MDGQTEQTPPNDDSNSVSVEARNDPQPEIQNPTPPPLGDDSESINTSNDIPNLSSPITQDPIGHKKPVLLPIVFAGLAALTFLIAVYAIYSWQHKKVDSLNSQLSAANTKITSLKANQAITAQINSGSNSSESTLKVSQFGISLTVPLILSDVTQVPNTKGDVDNLSTQSVGLLDPACLASSINAPLGSILKEPGKYTPADNTTLIKQSSAYSIFYMDPPIDCSKVTQVSSLVHNLVTDLKSTFPSVTSP